MTITVSHRQCELRVQVSDASCQTALDEEVDDPSRLQSSIYIQPFIYNQSTILCGRMLMHSKYIIACRSLSSMMYTYTGPQPQSYMETLMKSYHQV